MMYFVFLSKIVLDFVQRPFNVEVCLALEILMNILIDVRHV